MKIPKEITGTNKIRDAEICLAYEEWHDSDLPKTETIVNLLDRLAEKYGLTQRRIRQIVMSNTNFILNKEKEEFKQIFRIKRHIARAGDTKKDVHDWEGLLHDKVTTRRVEHSGKIDGAETKIIIVRPDGSKAQAVSGQVRVLPGEVSGDGVQLGDGKVDVAHLSGNVIQRAGS